MSTSRPRVRRSLTWLVVIAGSVVACVDSKFVCPDGYAPDGSTCYRGGADVQSGDGADGSVDDDAQPDEEATPDAMDEDTVDMDVADTVDAIDVVDMEAPVDVPSEACASMVTCMGTCCPLHLNASTTCVTTGCNFMCNRGWDDCAHTGTGCATPVNTNTNCGTCGNACGASGSSCTDTGSSFRCCVSPGVAVTCGVATCPAGFPCTLVGGVPTCCR